MSHTNLSVPAHANRSRAHLRLLTSSTDPLPRRNPGETFRKPPATVGRPRPVPQPQRSAA